MNSNAVISRFKDAASLTGIFSRIARKCEVTPNHVREVALGNRTSDRVMKALVAEMKRVQRRAVETERAA